MQGRGIGLDGAVGLHRNEAPLGAQPGLLRLQNRQMFRVHLRNHHRNIGGPTVGTVVGDHRALQLGVGLLQGTDLFLLHVHRTENKVHCIGNLFLIRLGIHNHQGFGLFWNGSGHGPTAAHGLLIGFSGRAGAGCHHSQLKPRVAFQQGDKALPHHSGGADHTHSILFHGEGPPQFLSKSRENGFFCWEGEKNS